ncbi:acyl-CoA dehydrogenase family protein [Sphingomonas oligophenolica]|uniref:Acyl-CoA dehydrogenase family protein n=1 Tax=Sphingomonas oligophenolica TaxID=301154 RepID=A0ABU9Y9Z1_9SPHN
MGWRVDDELQQMLRDSAVHFLGAAGGPDHFRKVRASDSGFDPVVWAQMGELGWTGILLPEAAGGSEMGLEGALTLAEELGRAIMPEPFIASAVVAATVLGASETQAALTLSRALAVGERSVTLAWQEQRGTIGVPAFQTRLDGRKLTGAKRYVPAWHADTGVLVAATDGTETVVVVVDPASPGVVLRPARLSDGSFGADIDFNGVDVGESGIILRGQAADQALDLAIARGTVALSAQLEGLAGALWHMTLDYMRQRSQFGSNLSDFQALRHRMVDLYSEVELAGASWRRASKHLADGATSGIALHAAKARCSQVAQDMGKWAIQYHGAFGYTDEADVGLYVHAALRWSSWLGNAASHRREALVAHRRERDFDA